MHDIIKTFTVWVLLVFNYRSGNTGFLGTFQRIGSRFVGNDPDNLSRKTGINQGL